MSKLYVSATTDAVKTYRTARGHTEAFTSLQYNFDGGNTADGAVDVQAEHRGDCVAVTVAIFRNGTLISEEETIIKREG